MIQIGELIAYEITQNYKNQTPRHSKPTKSRTGQNKPIKRVMELYFKPLCWTIKELFQVAHH